MSYPMGKRAEAQPVDDAIAPEVKSNIPLGTKHVPGPNVNRDATVVGGAKATSVPANIIDVSYDAVMGGHNGTSGPIL